MLASTTVEFFEAITSTNYVALSRFLSNPHFEPNIVSESGKWPLQLAIDQEDCELVELLLPRANLSHIRVAIFGAVARDNSQALTLILRSALLKRKKNILMLTDLGVSNDEFSTAGPDPLRPHFRPHDLRRPEGNPLTLAAIRGNNEIVRQLVEAGFTIKKPHSYFCSCRECTNMRQLDFVHFLRSRLASYNALATHAYLSLAVDPFLESFKLSVELEMLSQIDSDYSTEYRQLAEACRIFAVDLFNQCQGSDETTIILSHGNLLSDREKDQDSLSPAYKLAAVNLAILYGQKKFIAHPVTQRYALNEWYRGVEWLSLRGYTVFFMFTMVAVISYPFSSLVYLMPHSPKQVKMIMNCPYVKYLHRTVSYVTFLLIVFATLLDPEPDALWDYACSNHCCVDFYGYKSLMIIWILGFIASHCREMIHLGSVKAHFLDTSNIVEWLGLLCFVTGFILNFVVAALISQDPVHQAYYCNTVYRCRIANVAEIKDLNVTAGAITVDRDLSQAADIMIAFGDLFTFARLLFVMPSSSVFGPLTIAFQRMMADTVSVLFLWALIMFGFVSAISLLYLNYTCTNSDFANIGTLVKDLFWSSFGIGEINAPQINAVPPNNHSDEAAYLRLQQIFLNLSSQTVGVGYFLYGTYLMITAVVLVNMLIAIMSKTFDTIYNDRDAEWKFMRASLWLKHYETYNVTPIPFNLLEYLVEGIRWLISRVLKRSVSVNEVRQAENGDDSTRKKIAKYNAVCTLLVERLQQFDGYDVYSRKYVQDPLGLIVRGVSTVVEEQRHSADVVRNGLVRLEAAVCRLAKIRHVNVPASKEFFANPLRHRSSKAGSEDAEMMHQKAFRQVSEDTKITTYRTGTEDTN